VPTNLRPQKALPVGETLPIPPPVEPIPPTTTQRQLSAQLHQASSDSKKKGKYSPLLVRVVEDDELNSFEKKTVTFGMVGLLIAFLSFVAASAAGYFVFQQFKEMADQTELLSRAAQQSRKDSADSAITTAKQITILKGQLEQQQKSFVTEERGWISVSGTGFFYAIDHNQISRADSNAIIKNSGHSPALKVRIWRCGQVRDNEPNTLDQRINTHCRTDNIGMLGPDVTQTFEIADETKVVSAKSLDKTVYDPGVHFYAWGKITYRVINEKHQHVTRFCLVSGMGGNGMGPCRKGNEAN
jgi:hypothetical protein